MKKIILLLISCSIALNISAQRVSVTTGTEEVGDEFHPSYIVVIPHTNSKKVEKEWIGFLKDNNGKVKSGKKSINGSNVVFKSVGPDTMLVHSKVTENATGVSLIAAFKRNEVFITTADDVSKTIEGMLYNLALPLAKDGLSNKVKDASKAISKLSKENESLVKRNERLRSENEKMRNKTADNDREISDNEQRISKLNSELENKKHAAEDVKSMEKDLE